MRVCAFYFYFDGTLRKRLKRAQILLPCYLIKIYLHQLTPCQPLDKVTGTGSVLSVSPQQLWWALWDRGLSRLLSLICTVGYMFGNLMWTGAWPNCPHFNQCVFQFDVDKYRLTHVCMFIHCVISRMHHRQWVNPLSPGHATAWRADG